MEAFSRRLPVRAAVTLIGLAIVLTAAGGCGAMEMGRADAQAGLIAAEPSSEAAFDMGLVQRNLHATTAGVALHKSQPRPVPAAPGTASPNKRLVIYTADLHVRVPNLEDAMEKFLALVNNLGGHLQRQQNQTLTCRVPAERFDETLSGVRELGAVLHQSIEASDVSRQYLDLEIRLDNAMKSRERLLKLLEKADKVTDLLEVEKELKRLSEEIERMKGELRYLSDQVAFSTVQVTFNGPSPSPQQRGRVCSRFPWINQIGVDYVLNNF